MSRGGGGGDFARGGTLQGGGGVPKKARQGLASCKCRVFPQWSLLLEKGGVQGGGTPLLPRCTAILILPWGGLQRSRRGTQIGGRGVVIAQSGGHRRGPSRRTARARRGRPVHPPGPHPQGPTGVAVKGLPSPPANVCARGRTPPSHYPRRMAQEGPAQAVAWSATGGGGGSALDMGRKPMGIRHELSRRSFVRGALRGSGQSSVVGHRGGGDPKWGS